MFLSRGALPLRLQTAHPPLEPKRLLLLLTEPRVFLAVSHLRMPSTRTPKKNLASVMFESSLLACHMSMTSSWSNGTGSKELVTKCLSNGAKKRLILTKTAKALLTGTCQPRSRLLQPGH
jgi:hypothetical protein